MGEIVNPDARCRRKPGGKTTAATSKELSMMLREYGPRAVKIAVLIAALAAMCAFVGTAAPSASADDTTPVACDPLVDPTCVPDTPDASCDPSVDPQCPADASADDPMCDETDPSCTD